MALLWGVGHDRNEFFPKSELGYELSTNMFFKVTLIRSAIGLPKKTTRRVLESLGLRKRMQTVCYPVNQQTVGMILKVKELVRVEEVSKAVSPAEAKRLRKPPAGFYVEGN
ncbi:54S ribosomal protein L33, mitochondrial [Neolecta irregularis DAH-3]|uniref:Large ribosomal subunit protein uL30m n=1 Tax=Neolecta irregularis (strain DAH-3) TaxID=1198029 RepID=A0A1U7LQ66_NEOID|nr:54S ribosomal protein L33, mitochondrial [Neolecta irregularis DAH-3]|eukprot:OLL24797.1 54S ribosomal protein L33, mitochondrial [Neolecta irregularis DAH-3]